MGRILRFLQKTPRTVLTSAAILIAVIVLVDWRNPVNAYFGFLYVFPMLLVGTILSWWQLSLIAVFCTILTEILDEARIVLEPYCAESDIEVTWDIPGSLPSVWADRHGLLNVLLNLAKNSRRALEGAHLKRIDLSVTAEHRIASIRFCDTGPGLPSVENLFEPLQKGADATGLGLFLSRAFMRSFGGDLRYDAGAPGCCFVIELAIAGNEEE